METHHCKNLFYDYFNYTTDYLIFFRHLACEEGRVQEIGLLIKSGADTTLLNKDKLTPFDLAPADIQGVIRTK